MDISYCFSLKTPYGARLHHSDQDVLIEGDIFRMRDFYSFLATLKQRGDNPAFVTFEPMAGLQSYTPLKTNPRTKLHSRVTYQRLENNLRKLIEVVKTGGYIYLDRPFQFDSMDTADFIRGVALEDYQSFKWFKDLCKEEHCSVEIGSIFGTRFLIRRWLSGKNKSK